MREIGDKFADAAVLYVCIEEKKARRDSTTTRKEGILERIRRGRQRSRNNSLRLVALTLPPTLTWQ